MTVRLNRWPCKCNENIGFLKTEFVENQRGARTVPVKPNLSLVTVFAFQFDIQINCKASA